MDQFLTLEKANIGPVFNSIYIYIYAVELFSGPSLASLIVIVWAKFVLKNSACQKHYKNGVSANFLKK